ncbi:tetratricopeptide repeat protein [Lentzea sp. NEAU-D7]|uniref:tetratricopeptide repeat protein n=1 Tax=Lentzea sp. NEAU-D7 TaxID=2994667 RepID=UPI00224ABFDF|nr:tetratricopeptide repeat protein [Lentzea sp. NEAU-D7]MCX2950192.1 tetratricopeptide repeat protein [Lentzea sp. NEAU-D7]
MVILAGVAVLAVGGVMLAVGLDTADKIGSVVGAVCGMVGLGMSAYGLVVARSADRQTAPGAHTSVTNSASGSSVTGGVTQVGSVSRDLVMGGMSISGANPVVAGPGSTIIGRVEPVGPHTSAVAAEPLPPPAVELCIGRNEQIHAVSRAWRTGQWAVVTGGPGIGKSTLLGRAIGLDVIVTAFGERRFVVSCDGANAPGAVIDKMATALGVGLGEHLRNRVVSFLRAAPCALVLDNFETVTDADPAGAAELLSTLRAVPGLVAGIGSRGAHVPAGLVGLREINLGPLPQEAAVDVFVAVADEHHRADPALEALMADLDGVPLAIVLMASLARSESRLDTLAAAWRSKRTDLLQHSANSDRTSSLPVSIELSWDQLSPDGHTALSLAALLPDGWPHNKAGMYLPDELAAGVIELSHRALLHDDELRQRCLAPLRQHVLARHPPGPAQVGLLTAQVHRLTSRAVQVGRVGGAEAAKDVAPELTNLTEIIRAGLPSTSDLGDAVPDLLEFQRLTGLGDDQIGVAALAHAKSPTSRARQASALAQLYLRRSNNEQARGLFNQALPLYQRIGSVLGEANCLNNLGRLAFRESDNEQARGLFNQALPLYQRVGDVLGEANCLINLGRLAFRESDNEQARGLFNQALPLYQRVGDVLGEANCLINLGELAFRESDNEQARGLFNQALPLSQRIGSVLGEANCLINLGELAFRESDNEQARGLFNQALPLSQRVGDVLGEANCLSNLGRLAFSESDNEQARGLFNQALPLYQRIGSVLGEANCLINLGRLAFRESDNEQARGLFNQALPLYQRLQDRHSAAITHAWLARTTDNEQHTEHKSQMERLATELNLPDFHESLRTIAEG